MSKEFLMIVLVLLFAWSNRDRVPPEYQFWRHNDTSIKVVNNSDQDLADVKVMVWSSSHPLGMIRKGKTQELKAPRMRDLTDVVISFKYGNEAIERFAGTLDEEDDYKMVINVNYAGVITVQEGVPAAATE